MLPVQVLQPTPLIEVPRRGPAGTPTDTSKRVSDGEGEERQGRSHFLSLCLSLPDMHAQTRTRTARRQRQTRHTEGPEAQHGGRRTKRETHTRKARNTHTHTDTHSRKQRTHRYPEARRARERETHTHTRVQHVARTGRDEWVGRTARGRRTFCAQRVRSMRVQAGATATQTRTRTRTCDRRPRLLHGGGVAWRAVWAAADMSARGRRHTHCYLRKKKSHVHGSCDDDDRHTRCCASGQRPARRERPKGVHGHAYKWRERGGGVGGGDGEELRSMSALPTGAAGLTHRKQEHASRWATKNAAGARLRRETLCVNGCADAKQGRRLREQAREQVRADEAVVSAGGTRRWKAGKGRAYRRDARRAEENSRLKDNVGVEDGGAQRARFRDQICARRASRGSRRDEWDGRDGCGGARRRAGGRPRRRVRHPFSRSNFVVGV